MSATILPDSRLAHRPDLGSVMMDWPLGDGRTMRLETVPLFCANCGTDAGYCPKENTSSCFYLCQECFDKHGPPAGTVVLSDAEFRTKLQCEMVERYGRLLTDGELKDILRTDHNGPLALLLRESPYKEFRGG